jgi:hypothetical protein
MIQYQNTIDQMRAGTLFGPMLWAENKVVPSGVTFEFGDPVFVDEGDETKAYEPDSTDASLHFLGVAPISHRCYKDSVEQYVEYQEMNVLTKGKIYVHVASGVTGCANKPAYVVDLVSDGDYKKFTTTSSANTFDIGGYFRSNPNADGLAVVELRGVK